MIIEYTEQEIEDRIKSGNYDFIISDIDTPQSTDITGTRSTRLVFTIECLTDNITSMPIKYSMTVLSDNEQYQKNGRMALKFFIKGLYPNNWQEKLSSLNTEELKGMKFNADIDYKNNKYLNFKNTKPIINNKESNNYSEVPF